MRVVLLSAVVVIASIGATPMQAREIDWCLRSPSNSWNGDCMYYTYGQCLAALSGQKGDCRPNPFVASRARRTRGAGYDHAVR